MAEWLNSEVGKVIFEEAFEKAGLPEIDENDLEVGTYTNRQIAEMFNDPVALTALLMMLPDNDHASKRSILSFTVEIMSLTK